MNKKLYLEFQDQNGDTMKLTINDPADNLDDEKINLQMEAIIDSAVFNSKGSDLAEAKAAYIIEQTRTDFLDA